MKSKIFLGLLAIFLLLAGWYVLFPQQVAEIGVGLERSRSGLERKVLSLPEMEIVYLEGGSGEPLVLLHGFGADKDNWTRVARFLTPHFHVYAIDLPGFGESSRPEGWRYRIQDQVERVYAIADALGIGKPHLGGSSMGGFIAASLAARHPGDVSSLWLLAPGGVATAQPSEMMTMVEAGEPVPLLAQTPDDFERVFNFMFVDPPFVPSAFRRVLAARAAANYEHNKRILGQIRDDSIPLENLVSGLATPTRIVWGENDRVLHVSGADVLDRLMPNASVTRMPQTGHLPMIEHPKEVAEDYLAFRRSLQ